VRGFSYEILPISWHNRAAGDSKLRLQEMGSRYLFIVLYVWLEHHLSSGDYRRPGFRPARFRRRFSPGLRQLDGEVEMVGQQRPDRVDDLAAIGL